jgi:hypothetical protein
MPLWDVDVEETRSRTVVVEANSRQQAKAQAERGRDAWLDRGRATTVHLEAGDASPQTCDAQEPDCMDAYKYAAEGCDR